MAEIPTFVVLEGLLHESGKFELRRLFEDSRAEPASRFGQGGGPVTVALVDGRGEELARVSPPIRFPAGCGPSAGRMPGRGLLRAALAHHADARGLELRVGERLVYAAEVAPKRPEVGVKAGSEREGSVPLFVDAPDADVRVVAELTDGRRIAPVVRREGDAHEVDLGSLEGLGRASLVVEATRRGRTTRVIAVEVDLPEATVCGTILEPRPDARWPWGRRGSLIGALSDRNGRKVEWEPKRTSWKVDGEPFGPGRPLVPWQPDAAGTHTIELVHEAADGRVEVLDERTIEVEEETPEQKEWAAAVEALREGSGSA
ncbi:MAG: hypothetical protein PVI57_15595 [Gemmatimonadota bacterium]|jgi:hypothetical protein